MTKLSNLEKIRKAYAMGWAAQIKNTGWRDDGYVLTHILSHDDNFYFLRPEEGTTILGKELINNSYEIAGYLYAGQLAGNEEVPEGQRFRLRRGGLIGIYASTWDKKLRIKFNEFDEMYYASREEVEPVFD